MASILRVPVVWSGLSFLPGVSVFYWDGGVLSDISGITDFFDGIKARFPSGLTWTIPGAGDSIDDATGAIDGFWTASGGGAVAATGTPGARYAAGAGARVRWRTDGLRNGRRVVGTTFLVPLISDQYDASGTIDDPALASIQSEANTLAALGAMLIWSKPSPGGSDGASHTVVSATVPDRATSLRSRRY